MLSTFSGLASSTSFSVMVGASGIPPAASSLPRASSVVIWNGSATGATLIVCVAVEVPP